MPKSTVNPFLMAQSQLDAIAKVMNLNEGVHQLLREPVREVSFTIPVRHGGVFHLYRGFRVLHNDALGPGKGGIRFHPDENIDTIRALSMWMTWKTALLELPLGGAKGGVICDPRSMDDRQVEKVARGYVRNVLQLLGPLQDIPAPDVMTNEKTMAWMMDEYVRLTGKYISGVITGKPLGLGGSQGRPAATGKGVVYTIREAMKFLGIDPYQSTCAIQGFGNVGRNAALAFEELGGKVVAVSDVHGCIYCPTGLDLEQLLQVTNQYGEINREQLPLGCQDIDDSAWMELEVDVLIPAALDGQIRKDNVDRINPRVKIIAEGANGPTTPEADSYLSDRGVFVIPDFLCNSGGVVVSYFEGVQNTMNFYWSEQEVYQKLDEKISKAFHEVNTLSQEKSIPLREAAQMIAIDRVAKAMTARGWV